MEELIKMVSQKTGLSADQSKMAVEIVIGFLKKKLPSPIAGQIDAALTGGGLTENLTKGLGGLFGKK